MRSEIEPRPVRQFEHMLHVYREHADLRRALTGRGYCSCDLCRHIRRDEPLVVQESRR